MRRESNPSFDELFVGAIALKGEERSRYLDSHCGADPRLRSEIEDLLRCHDAAGDFLEVPPITSLPEPVVIAPPVVVEETMPTRIGHFRIERALGVGGMGRVYLAQSDQPRRWVALKVVRSGLGAESLRRRFEQEAQVVALLQHPGIAQLYEAGAADTGCGSQPFFAMEYVDGLTLTEHARRHNLTTRQRLELFCRICDAVEHAHQRGVIHRDLKPGNILVDSTGQPKILDFGVARLIDPDTASGDGRAMTTLHTQAGQLIGTLSYMSPEQVAGSPSDVDARSDVYSLGVVLYELLAGRLPHDVATCSIPEAIRAIREDTPASLSTIDRALRGDIDTIVGKAIEKEPARRYQSAAELASDIRRSLRDEPIVARPPSTWYQLGKFAKRNKALVGGVAATILALSAGLVVAVWQARKAEAAKVEAQSALRVSEEVNRFMNRLFASPSPDKRMGREVTVMQVLDQSADHIENDLADQPHVRATLHRTIGNTYRSLTAFAQAEAHLRRAYQIHLELYGEHHEETIESMTHLLLNLSAQGKRKEALELATRQWEIAKEFFHPDDPERAVMASNLSLEMAEVGKWKEAEELQRFVLAERQRLLEPDNPGTLLAMHNLGRTLGRTGRLHEAVKLQRDAVALHRESGRPMDVNSFTLVVGLVNTLMDLGEYDEAEPLTAEALEEGAELFYPEHNAMLIARNARGQIWMHKKRLDEAEAEFRELVRLQAHSEIPVVDGLARVKSNLGEVLRRQGRLEEAEAEFRHALKLLDESEVVPDRLRIGILNNLATVLRLQNSFEDALPVYEELVRVSESVLAPHDPVIAVSKYGYALVLLAHRRPDECEAQLQGAYDIALKNFTETHPPVIAIMRSFLNLYELWQTAPDLEPAFQESLRQKAEQWRQKLPEQYR